VATVFTEDTGKSVMQHPAIQVTINYLLDVGAEKTVPLLEPVVIDHFECLEMVLHALVIWRVLGIALSVYGFRHGLPHPLAVENKTIFNSNMRAGLNKMDINTIYWIGIIKATRYLYNQ
jgi:hypothetical protein